MLIKSRLVSPQFPFHCRNKSEQDRVNAQVMVCWTDAMNRQQKSVSSGKDFSDSFPKTFQTLTAAALTGGRSLCLSCAAIFLNVDEVRTALSPFITYVSKANRSQIIKNVHKSTRIVVRSRRINQSSGFGFTCITNRLLIAMASRANREHSPVNLLTVGCTQLSDLPWIEDRFLFFY